MQLRVVVGQAHSGFWTYIKALEHAISPEQAKLTLIESEGANANIDLLIRGQVELAVAPAAWVHEQDKEGRLCALAPAYSTVLLSVSQGDSGITNIGQLRSDHRASIGPEGSSTHWYFSRILKALQVNAEVTPNAWIDQFLQFKDKKVDLIAFASSQPNPQIKRLFEKNDARIIGFSQQEMTLIQDILLLNDYSIPAFTYKNQIKPIKSAEYWTYLYTRCDWAEPQLEQFVANIFNPPRPAPGLIVGEQLKESLNHWAVHKQNPFHWASRLIFEQLGFEVNSED